MKDTEPITPLDYIKNIRLCETEEQVEELDTYARKDENITCQQYEIIQRTAQSKKRELLIMSIEEYVDKLNVANSSEEVTEICSKIYLDTDISSEELLRLRPFVINKLEEVFEWEGA